MKLLFHKELKKGFFRFKIIYEIYFWDGIVRICNEVE